MTFVAKLRSQHWLPRAALTLFLLAIVQTTLLPCAMANSAPAVAHHCSHCPASHDNNAGACATVLVSAAIYTSNAHPLIPTFDHVPMRIAFGVENRLPIPIAPAIHSTPRPLSRSLHLTHCVQLK